MQFSQRCKLHQLIGKVLERPTQSWRRSVEVDIADTELWQLCRVKGSHVREDKWLHTFTLARRTQEVVCTTSPVGSEDAKSTAVWSTSLPMWYAAEVIVGSRAPASASSPEQFPTSPNHDVPRQTRRHVLPFDWQPTVASMSVRLIQNVVGSLRSAQPVTVNVV